MSPAPLRTVRAENPSPMTLDGTRTFIVGGGRPAVIDPGPDDARHLDAIEAALSGATPVAIVLTHGHADHAAAAPELSRRTGAPVCMAPGGLASAHGRIDRWLADGDRVETDAGTLRVIATPGHAPEHVSLLWTGPAAPAGGALFVGDLLMGEGDTTLVAPPEGDLDAYLRSLDRLDEIAPGIVYPAHGPPLEDPLAAIARYREHRLARIEQVRAARRANPGADEEELVEIVYGRDLHPELRSAAAGSVRAVLAYLAVRGEDPYTPRE